MDKNEKLKGFLLKYSFYDLVQSFFVLNLWLPNIASPIKIQYLYVILESIQKGLPAKRKIKSYIDFETFCRGLFILLPSFGMLEDYVPEPDWGEIKYFLDNEFYKLFYGGDLSNSYDFYYSYEIIHRPFEQQYLDLIKRSPISELRFCLELQDHILNNLKQDKIDLTNKISPGYIEVPPVSFWKNASGFIDLYRPEDDYSESILSMYTKKFTKSTPLPSMDSFIENAYRGRNCQYFFIKKDNKYYPVMPRKWLTVLYDTWGTLLKNNYEDIIINIDNKDPSIFIGIELAKFIMDRIDSKNVFPYVAPLREDQKPPHELRFTAVLAEDKLFLIYITPPIFNEDKINNHLKEISPKLKESGVLVKKTPVRLGIFAKGQTLEIKTLKEGRTLEPIFIIILPSPLSDIIGCVSIPDEIEAKIITLDQIVGIFDEIENSKDLSDFFNYLDREREHMAPLNSYLDIFGSFRDSKGVLVPGAIEPNKIILDFSWGSNYRFKSLKEFWNLFPEESFYGHPRSWRISNNGKTKTGLILDSRNFFGYTYYQKIEKVSFFINGPVHLMELQEGEFNDTIMHSLFDAIDIYSYIIGKLDFTKSHNKAHIFFCPATLVLKKDELAHLRHLVQNTNLWAMDRSRIHSGEYGIRVIYDQGKLMDSLKDVTDRSIQIQLLIDVLEQLNILYPDLNFQSIKSELEKEKYKKARFGTFIAERWVSFPEGISTLLPDHREYKLADKEIAKIALGLDIRPGTYSAEDGKKKLNNLRSKIVEVLNTKIQSYGFKDAIPVLLEKSNALIYDSWRTEIEIKAARNHEVDYERSERSSEKEKKSLHWYRIYRYLIEKFVHLQPAGSTELDKQSLKELLAFTDRLVDLYVASDFINYELYPVNVNINRDYIVSTYDEVHDIVLMGKEYAEEQAKINLGIIGNKNDMIDSSFPIDNYLDKLNNAFKKDFVFRFRNFINVLQVLALWAVYAKKEEQTHYCATREEITSVCSENIIGYDLSEINNILNFLTLEPKEISVVKGDPLPTEDVPIWEHNKRLMRFDLRPLIRIGNHYYWAPHSMDRTTKIWINTPNKHRLPSDFDAPTVKAILEKGHEDLRNCLVEKIEEITSRYTPYVKKNVYPHKFDQSICDIGDYDVLAYLKNKNLLLNIESKIIDPAYSNKDAGRLQRKLFGEKKEDGTFKKGYLQRVEKRARYLNAKAKYLITKLSWEPSTSNPKIISIFVTEKGYWWTKFPPISTKVNFVEIRLLDEFIKNF